MAHPTGRPDPIPWDLDKLIKVADGQVSLVAIEDETRSVPVVALYLKSIEGREYQFALFPGQWEGAMADYLAMVERSPEWGG